MAKSLRLSEKWFHRGLWLVSVVFAWFLVGLGSSIVDDLPQVEHELELSQFYEQPHEAQQLKDALQKAQEQTLAASEARERAQLQLSEARSNTQAAQDSFRNWLATRAVTQRSEDNPEVVSRNKALEALRNAERQAQQELQNQDRVLLNTRQHANSLERELSAMDSTAHERMYDAQRSQELRVFLYRLALTLPLLVIAGLLFIKQRKSTWWPFVWGFIFFALFAFFVELVPYLPSYGGYVRYAVGIIITILVGRWAIVALQRYLERQKQAEALPAHERRNSMAYDAAMAHLSKSVCPGCERPVDLKDGITNFCPHCGIGLFMPCQGCGTRKSCFTKFCFSCGTVNDSISKD